MTSDLVDIFLLGLVAISNPSRLLAAVTVMLLLPNPKLDRLRDVPTGSAHLASILRAP